MEVKKNPKANLSNWSNIFLLLGLALMLLFSWRAIEWKSYNRGNLAGDVFVVGDDLEKDIPITQQILPPPPPPPPPVAATPEIIQVVEDEAEVEETLIESTETSQNMEIVEIEAIEEVDVEEEEIEDVPFAVIETVPVYPGCETAGNNAAKKLCMSDNISVFVVKNFNSELANELGLEGRQKINVQFKIDSKGKVVNVRARAPHPRLEKEAVRVVESLPEMTPGKQRGKPVGVLYSLPIIFQVEN